MDKIFLTDLNIETIIGIYAWERETKQRLQFDLEMDWNIQQAAVSEDINDTLDYNAITQRIVEFVSTSQFLLIETLAEQVSALLLKEFAIPKLKLTLTKPVQIHGNNIAKIVIERPR